MAEVQQFVYGWVTPVAAVVMSVSGCLLGILLATKAPFLSGRRRVRLLIYASIAIAVTGVWLAQIIGLIGFDVPPYAVRYDPLLIGAGLGVALVTVTAAIFLVGYGTLRFWRMFLAGALIGSGIAGTHHICAASLRLGGLVEYDQMWFIASVAIAMVAACAAVWFIVALKGLRAAFIAATVMATAICATHYTGMYAIRVDIDPDAVAIVAGINSIMLVGIVALGTAINVMLWYFTVGSSTMYDLHAIFESPEKSIEIEPWMIHEVTARIAIDVTPVPDVAPEDLPQAGPTRRPPGPRPTPGITPVWRTMPVWGSTADSARRWQETVRKPEPIRAARADAVDSAAPVPARASARPEAEPTAAGTNAVRRPDLAGTAGRVSAATSVYVSTRARSAIHAVIADETTKPAEPRVPSPPPGNAKPAPARSKGRNARRR